MHKINLQTALETRMVQCRFLSLSGYKGHCVKLEIKNLGKDSVCVLIPAGLKLDSKNQAEQDLLVTENSQQILATGETKICRLKANCCQASHRAPKENGSYVPVFSADSSLNVMAQYLSRQHFPADIEQMAVWTVSNHHAVANIPDSSEALVSLRYLAAALSGQTIPWYSIQSKTFIMRDRSIVQVSVEMRGHIKYNNDKEQYVTFSVINEHNQLVGKMESRWLMPGQNQSYPVALSLAGFEKGEYTIHLRSRDAVLATEMFEL